MTPAEKVRELALTASALTAVIGARFYVATNLPAGYNPIPISGKAATTGPAVLWSGGSGPPNETSTLAELNFQVRCYAASEEAAQELDTLLFQALNEGKRGKARSIRCTNMGQHVADPDDAGWHYFLSSWQVTAAITPQ